MAATRNARTTRAPRKAAQPKAPVFANPATDWVPGTQTKDGFTHIWWHSYYSLAAKPRSSGKGRDWVAILLDGHTIHGANIGEVEPAARSYGKDKGLIAKAKELKVTAPEGVDLSKAPAMPTPAPAPAPATKKAPARGRGKKVA